jgi:hypothetical protein
MKPLHARLAALEAQTAAPAVNPIFIGDAADAPAGTLVCLPRKADRPAPPTAQELAEARAERIAAQQSQQSATVAPETVAAVPAVPAPPPAPEPPEPRAYGNAKPLGSFWPASRAKDGRLW